MSAIARQLSDNGPTPLRVLIADDHPLMLAGIRRTLARSEEIEIVGDARSAQEVLERVEQALPHVVPRSPLRWLPSKPSWKKKPCSRRVRGVFSGT